MEAIEPIHWTEGLLAAAAAVAESGLGLRGIAERRGDLERALAALASTLAAPAGPSVLAGALSAPDGLAVLARHLTIGESYFWREREAVDTWLQHVLAVLARSRPALSTRRLRAWSAGCATGEEPYSLALQLEQALPDLAEWQVEIFATDVNPDFLATARRARYRDWSFRGVEAATRERHFERDADGLYVLDPRARDRVRFTALNLAEEAWPAPFGDRGTMDLVLCRHVLMYLTPSCARGVVRRLHDSLVAGGSLLVGAAESALPLFDDFERLRIGAAVILRKPGGPGTATKLAAAPAPQPPRAAPRAPAMRPFAPVGDDGTLARRARQEADRGAFDAALFAAERAVAANRTDGSLHYLHASILVELGRDAEAAEALRRAVYLAPDMALAHFTLGVLARGRGESRPARRHFDNALTILARRGPEESVGEVAGLTVAELADIVRSTRGARLGAGMR